MNKAIIKMDDEIKKAIELHSAGATVRHQSGFSDLVSYQNEIEIDQSFRNMWVIPYYFNLAKTDEEWISRYAKLLPKITDSVILKNMGNFNWRTRSTGAFFAALKGKKEFIEIIGTHLLKSEVCYAGKTYVKTLAYFNDEAGNQYLEKYLAYYLKQPSLYFDQANVFIAIKYLDKINGTNIQNKYFNDWKTFCKHQEREVDVVISGLEKEIDTIIKIKTR